MFIAGKILAAIVLPPGLFALIAAIASVLMARGKKKAAIVLAVADAVLIYALSTSVFSGFLVAPLESRYPPLASAEGAVAVVALGGGYNESSPEYGYAGALTPVSTERAVYALALSRRYGLPLVFSGGAGYGSTRRRGSEAEAAGRLWLSLGVEESRITMETASLDTKGNAAGVAALSLPGPIILVTSAMHMPRAVLAFERAGLSVIAAPTDYHRGSGGWPLWSDFLPDGSRLELSRFALHEYVGLLYYGVTL